MKIVINEPVLKPQIVGLGRGTSEIYLILNFSDITILKDKFIIEAVFKFKGEVYSYSKIRNVSEIDINGNLDIGEITALGEYKDESDLEDFKVTLTYVDTVVS